jgi:hypothetical protein
MTDRNRATTLGHPDPNEHVMKEIENSVSGEPGDEPTRGSSSQHSEGAHHACQDNTDQIFQEFLSQ